MTAGKWAVRLVFFAGALGLSLILAAFLAVQIQQRLLRWRTERLLADMHQIRLYQSTWADAQRLMHRWGVWGYYEGSCTVASCKYEIELGSIDRYNPRVSRRTWPIWLLRYDRLNLYQWFGGRLSVFHASFTVHDGTIWREGTWMGVSVPRRRMRRFTNADTILTSDDFDWTLSVGAGSHDRLSELWLAGGDENLAGHPYYKVGRPGGCKVLCQMVLIYYSTRTPSAEIERLTSYDFSCFTRFNPCARIVDLLPAAEEWHMCDSEYESGPTVPVPKPGPPPFPRLLPIPCSNIPVWAQARDARYVLTVEALSSEIVKAHEDWGEFHREVANVKVINSLKEPAPWLPGAIVSIHLSNWDAGATSSSHDEHMVPGRRYIVFPVWNYKRPERITKDAPIQFERCGVQEDNPEIHREIEKGFAQNDALSP